MLNRRFEVLNQHNWILFDLELPEGSHQISVSGMQGAVELMQTFETSGEHWAVVDFWFYPEDDAGPFFTFHVRDEQIGFA